MATWKIPGPDKEWLDMPDVLALLGNVSDTTVRRLIATGRFPRPIKAGVQSPPRWHASAIACWQFLQPMLEEGEGEEEDIRGAK